MEDIADIAPNLTKAMTINGKLIGIPVRHATIGLFYNETLLNQRGITAPPTTLEELVDQAKHMTYRTDDGHPVVGMVLASDLSVFPVTFARAYGGDIGARSNAGAEPLGAGSALATMRGLFEAGALPRAVTRRHRMTMRRCGCSRDVPRSPCIRSRATPNSIARISHASQAKSRPWSSQSRRNSRANAWKR